MKREDIIEVSQYPLRAKKESKKTTRKDIQGLVINTKAEIEMIVNTNNRKSIDAIRHLEAITAINLRVKQLRITAKENTIHQPEKVAFRRVMMEIVIEVESIDMEARKEKKKISIDTAIIALNQVKALKAAKNGNWKNADKKPYKGALKRRRGSKKKLREMIAQF